MVQAPYEVGSASESQKPNMLLAFFVLLSLGGWSDTVSPSLFALSFNGEVWIFPAKLATPRPPLFARLKARAGRWPQGGGEQMSSAKRPAPNPAFNKKDKPKEAENEEIFVFLGAFFQRERGESGPAKMGGGSSGSIVFGFQSANEITQRSSPRVSH